MNRIRTMKMGTLLVGAVVLTLIPLLIVGFSAISSNSKMGQSAEHLEKEAEVIQDIGELRYNVQLYRVNIYALLYLQDASKIDECNRISGEITKIIDRLKETGTDTELIDDIEAKRAVYRESVKSIFDNYTDDKAVKPALPAAVAAQKEYMAAVEVLVQNVDKEMDTVVAQSLATKASSLRTTIFSIVFGLAMITAIIILIQLYVIKPLRTSFSELAKTSQRLAGSSQELSSNSEAMSQATTQITTAISQVATGATDQSSSAGEAARLVDQIAGAIQQVATGANTQATSVNETAAGISQLLVSIEMVAENANVVAEVADSTVMVADKGKTAVEETVTGMERIKTTVNNSAAKIQELGEKSKQIGEIIEVIDDIAEQTNLLALNAAIEAARAGEHGKGFAVVADEVRKLAERSAKATGEIANLIKGIQSETMHAVSAMEAGMVEVEQGSELAENAGSAITEMMTSIKQVVTQIAKVSENTGQMASASNQVSQAVDQIAAISQENSSAAEQVASSASQVVNSVDSIAASSQESAAVAEEVSASAEEQSASIEEISAQVQALAGMSVELDRLVGSFNL